MYTYTWKKYLPVIRLLLKRSATADQQMSLNRIDFEKGNKTRKPVVSFSFEIIDGKLQMLNLPVAAKDLLEILMQDDTARTLIRQNHYFISLDTNLHLSVRNNNKPGEDAGSDDEGAEKEAKSVSGSEKG
jgi:hypothetical protein